MFVKTLKTLLLDFSRGCGFVCVYCVCKAYISSYRSPGIFYSVKPCVCPISLCLIIPTVMGPVVGKQSVNEQSLFESPDLSFTVGVNLGIHFVHFLNTDHSVLYFKHALLISRLPGECHCREPSTTLAHRQLH